MNIEMKLVFAFKRGKVNWILFSSFAENSYLLKYQNLRVNSFNKNPFVKLQVYRKTVLLSKTIKTVYA